MAGPSVDEKGDRVITDKTQEPIHIEDVTVAKENLAYDNVDEEPELHAKTWFAVVAMFILSLVQALSMQGAAMGLSYIGNDLNNMDASVWVANSFSLVQTATGPILSSASDTFQARKWILVICSLLAAIGAAICPTASDIYRVIGGQVLMGFGLSTQSLTYCIPSEILPRKWRPLIQAGINVGTLLGACGGPLMMGGLTKASAHNGWRQFYWIIMGLWLLTTIGIVVGYVPAKRHTRYDHLSLKQKLASLDFAGFSLLASGLALFLTGLNLGGREYW